MSNDKHDDRFHLSRTDQYKALANPLRRRIIDLATQRPATVAEFAAALQRPPGTVAHHVHVLVAADLLHVVRTRQVRAVTEHVYGRTAPTFFIDDAYAEERQTQALADFAAVRRPAVGDEASSFGMRFLRLPDERARALVEEFTERLDALALEAHSGDTVYGILVSIDPTTIATLPAVEPAEDALDSSDHEDDDDDDDAHAGAEPSTR